MSLVAVAGSREKERKSLVWLKLPLGAAAAVLFALGAFHALSGPGGAPDGIWHTVVPVNMDVKVVKDGELQAVSNIDIVSRVEGQRAIQSIVAEGASVGRGEVLVVLDSADIRQKLEDTTLNVQKAENDLTNSREML